MPRKPRKPGVIFRVWTSVVGLFSPGKGKRRVNSKMTELYEAFKDRDSRLAVQESDNAVLRQRLKWTETENQRLRTARDMEDAVNTRTASRSRESAADKVDTTPIPVVSTK